MESLLNALSAPEFWVWGWLSIMYRRELRDIIFIEQGEGPALYSRKQFTRILRSLEAKKFLVIDHLPGNQHQDLVVVIDKGRCLDIGVPAMRHACPGRGSWGGNKKSGGTSGSGQQMGESGEGTGALGPAGTPMSGQGCSASASASKDLKIKALVEEKNQEQLLKAICEASPGQRVELQSALMRIAPMARGKKLSSAAVLYAAVRFLQDGGGTRKPAAWVEEVAKRAERIIRQGGPWKEDSSGSGTRLPSLEASGGRSTSLSGKP